MGLVDVMYGQSLLLSVILHQYSQSNIYVVFNLSNLFVPRWWSTFLSIIGLVAEYNQLGWIFSSFSIWMSLTSNEIKFGFKRRGRGHPSESCLLPRVFKTTRNMIFKASIFDINFLMPFRTRHTLNFSLKRVQFYRRDRQSPGKSWLIRWLLIQNWTPD